MVVRFLGGCAGAATLTIGGGTIANMIPVANRSKYIAVFCVGGALRPILGSVFRGFLFERAG